MYIWTRVWRLMYRWSVERAGGCHARTTTKWVYLHLLFVYICQAFSEDEWAKIKVRYVGRRVSTFFSGYCCEVDLSSVQRGVGAKSGLLKARKKINVWFSRIAETLCVLRMQGLWEDRRRYILRTRTREWMEVRAGLLYRNIQARGTHSIPLRYIYYKRGIWSACVGVIEEVWGLLLISRSTGIPRCYT